MPARETLRAPRAAWARLGFAPKCTLFLTPTDRIYLCLIAGTAISLLEPQEAALLRLTCSRVALVTMVGAGEPVSARPRPRENCAKFDPASDGFIEIMLVVLAGTVTLSASAPRDLKL